MITYALWYLAGAVVYLFIDTLRCAEEIKKMNTTVLLFSVVLAGLFWPLAMLAQIFLVVVVMALRVNNFFTKGSK